jgi:GNAT superfamily N-acetyltransferase
MEAIVRAGEQRDAAAILTLAKAFATSFVVEQDAFQRAFAAMLAATDAHLLVAEWEEQVIGYLLGFEHPTFYANGRAAWVEEITVGEPFRRHGVGRLLMEDFERRAVERGARLVALATRRAARFYQALGYEESATYFRKLLV